MDTQFWILALCSTLGYELNNLMMLPHIRKYDAMSAGIYRNLSLGISFLPLTLYAVPRSDWAGLLDVWHWILISALISVVAVWCHYEGLKRVPLGIFSTVSMGIKIMFFMLWGMLFFEEYIEPIQIVGIAILVGGMAYLGAQKKTFDNLKPSSWKVNLLLVLAAASSVSILFMFVVKASREANPLLVAHVWEFTIGLCSLAVILVRGRFGYGKLELISPRSFGKILLAACPTVMGTGCYALASTMGPVAVLGAVGTIGIGINAIAASVLFKEKLSPAQWGGIAISLAGILILKLVS